MFVSTTEEKSSITFESTKKGYLPSKKSDISFHVCKYVTWISHLVLVSTKERDIWYSVCKYKKRDIFYHTPGKQAMGI